MSKADLSRLPAVEKTLQALDNVDLPRPIILNVVRQSIKELRADPEKIPEFNDYINAIRVELEALARTRISSVINGTGVLIHTNMGRSPLPDRAADRLCSIATNYNNLELDLNTGERGNRASYLEKCLALVSGSESATSVNNCASALVIILRHFVRGNKKRVIISRSQLVEIGGGFRIPDILLASGAILHEIGTTNKTTVKDYENAISDETALILKVHQSNFYMGGFIENAETEELAQLAKKKGVPFCEDLGSGAVVNTEEFGPVNHEPTPSEILAKGVDLLCFSGDKLLGGPQAGIIAGRSELVEGIKKEPFFRALRCDKLILSMLEEVTESYLRGITEVPILDMLSSTTDQLNTRAESIVNSLKELPLSACIGKGESRIGGGTMPKSTIPSITIDLQPENISISRLAENLRFNTTPVMGYVADGQFKIDLRTIFSRQDKDLLDAIKKAVS
ncbi:MAG: L-seryl-tRNA(Sec) selenium transferase [Verrucomicrobiaceae bacterium]|nr:L-seryl-tRNA(Sec) selenium transferase [Verrucomicrobiaceae bacterium]